ncbi:MAG: amidohydrolase family protein [Acidobacteriaceae bacterium]
MTLRIDAHHHLWSYSAEDHGWIGDRMTQIRRDFLPADLEAELKSANIDGAVAVQTRQALEETEWLLRLASQHEVMRGVVGWAPIASPDFAATLERLREHRKLKGLRHVAQDEPDDAFLLREDFNAGIGLLRDTGLVYDILIFERHLPNAIQFVDLHPHQAFVLDHIGKPRIAQGEMEPWAANIRELARRENATCKLSGMATEADWAGWSLDTLRPYAEVVLEAFGADRVMMGSDWPVCLLAASYGRWVGTVEELVAALSQSERESVLGGTAMRVYDLA